MQVGNENTCKISIHFRISVHLRSMLEPEPGSNAFYSANHIGKVKREIEALSNVQFKLKDLGPTLTSLTVNGDLSKLLVMSAQLRHSSYSTTQRYCLKMEQGAAGKQLKDAWKDSPTLAPQNARNPVIGRKFDISGYS